VPHDTRSIRGTEAPPRHPTPLEALARAQHDLLAEARDRLDLRERDAFVDIGLQLLAREAAEIAAAEWVAGVPTTARLAAEAAGAVVIPSGNFKGRRIA
jgi:hypothetical protein